MFGSIKIRKVKADETRIDEWIDRIVLGIKDRIMSEALATCDKNLKTALSDQDRIHALKEEKQRLTEELDKLKSKARLEEAEFKGLIKLREDRLALDLEKKSVEMDRKFFEKEMGLLKQGHEQHIKAIADQSKRLDQFMQDAMECLKSASAPREVKKD